MRGRGDASFGASRTSLSSRDLPAAKSSPPLDGFRVRQGPYRIVYSVDRGVRAVIVVKVGDRKEVYRHKK